MTTSTPLLHAARLAAGSALVLLAGCADRPPWRAFDIGTPARLALAENVAAPPRPAASAALPTAAAALPAPAAKPEAAPEPRFDLIVNGAPARDVFLSMVAETRYSMLMHPEVAGALSVTLRGVTVREALDSIRDVYGYDYRIDGRRITVYPPSLQTRIFSVNYLHNRRQGRSELRVSGGSAPASNNNNAGSGTSAAGAAVAQPESSQVTTSSTSDIWAETAEVLRSMVGSTNGRAVVTSPQSGTIAVRAMPDELRQVDNYLRAARITVERQVMLEAKIVEVELREGFESGVDWSVLRTRGAIGQASGYAGNPLLGNANGLPTLPAALDGLRIDGVALPGGGAGTLGLSLATNGFSAVLGFLETQGDVQILSSPRVATLNNQKAVLKVGTDEYFVTNVSGGSIATGTGNNNTGTTTLPTLTLTPFFSGIALDVTPQIDEADMITLHVHPSVTSVTEKTKQVDLGTIGNYRLPLASSSVNETDTVVRVSDGNIVAIGGLMQQESSRRSSGLPGASGNIITRTLFGNNAGSGRKKELVVLIKPTVIRGADDWQRTTREASAAVDTLEASRRRVITLDGKGAAPPK